MIKIGDYIKQTANRQGMSLLSLASSIGMSAPGLYNLLKNNNPPVNRLLQISQTLRHNFFQYYTDHLGFDPNPRSPEKTEIAQLKQQLQTLRRENQLLNDVLQILKSQNQPIK